MSRLNNGSGNGGSARSRGTDGSRPTGGVAQPNSGLQRALQRLFRKLPEGYSAFIEKTGRVAVVCTDHQLVELQKSSKARVYVRRENGELKATKVTPMDQEPKGDGQGQPAIARPRKPQPKNDGQAETTPTRRKKKQSKGLRF
jgi:hypothetical protein